MTKVYKIQKVLKKKWCHQNIQESNCEDSVGEGQVAFDCGTLYKGIALSEENNLCWSVGCRKAA